MSLTGIASCHYRCSSYSERSCGNALCCWLSSQTPIV